MIIRYYLTEGSRPPREVGREEWLRAREPGGWAAGLNPMSWTVKDITGRASIETA